MNMSYCQFENTMRDLEQCVEAMGNAPSMSELDFSSSEERAFHAMWRVCRDFIAEHERLMNAEYVKEEV